MTTRSDTATYMEYGVFMKEPSGWMRKKPATTHRRLDEAEYTADRLRNWVTSEVEIKSRVVAATPWEAVSSE